MANIMINESCNQRCSYCFASEFVNIHKNNISYENFVKATDFILTESDNKRKGRIGLIGGEPLLHPEFDKFVTYLTSRDDVNKVTVYTNGVLTKEHIDCLLNDKVGLLINVNSVQDVGADNYQRTEEAIELLINKYNKKNRLTIGLNIYDNIDYSFFINMADKYGLPRVRLAVVVPAYGKERNGFSHFMELKDKVIELAKSLLLRDIRFMFDCNVPIPCMWSEKELQDFELMGLSSTSRNLISMGHSTCSPVIDILPDLTAIRCFGLSDISKVSIKDFSTIMELRNYFFTTLDSVLLEQPFMEKCPKCKLYPTKCFGGCLANRAQRV